jgi:methionine-S-sulfoxide reductase
MFNFTKRGAAMLARAEDPRRPDRAEIATFAAGCFWGVEAVFREIDGVLETRVGYTGGGTPSPTYEQVCRDGTGHAEAVEVTFDPTKVSYQKLLETFWRIHDPSTPNRQGWDVGSQYRSAIFVHDAEQASAAAKSRDEEQLSVVKPIVTEITWAGPFYEAEDYHQQYFEKQGRATCAVTLR